MQVLALCFRMEKTMIEGRNIVFLLIFFCSIKLIGQENIDFTHKAIDKEIEKKLEISDYQLVHCAEPDTDLIQGKYFSITDSVSHIGYVYVGRVNSCRAGGCSVSTPESANFGSEYFDYLILFTNDIRIQSVKVFNYQATQGHEVCSRAWLKQFQGYNGENELKVGKDIDGISGATVSVYSLTFDIEKVSFRLKENNSSWNKMIKNTAQSTRRKDY